MTATSRPPTDGQQKARDARGLGGPTGTGPTTSDREGRSAAAAACGVRVLEGEPRLLEIALVVQGDAVQVLGAEAVHETPHSRGLNHDVIVPGFVFDVQAVAKSRAAPGEHRDPEPGGLGRNLLLRSEERRVG